MDAFHCIMERMPPTCIPNRHVHLYKWRMHDALYRFTDSQATQLTGCPLPRSSRASFDTEQVSFDTQSIHHMIAQCKWNRKPVFKKKENKQRLTLCITQEHLNPMIQRSMMYNRRRLVPIVMFDNVANIHWIEYILFVTIQKDITIGVSLRYNERCGVQITGIHLDKMMIMEQHEVLLSHSQNEDECHCLDGFTSIINDMKVGNCDDLLNAIKSYKKKCGIYKRLAEK
eukprot:313207_1